jgi:hypothetical protein
MKSRMAAYAWSARDGVCSTVSMPDILLICR